MRTTWCMRNPGAGAMKGLLVNRRSCLVVFEPDARIVVLYSGIRAEW
jgi:hypothetical protein